MLPASSPAMRSPPFSGSSSSPSPAAAERPRLAPPDVERKSSDTPSPLAAPTASCPAILDNLAKPMMICVFGTPSALTYWGIHLLRTIMQVVFGDYHFIHSIYIEDLRQAWTQRGDKSVLFVSECPESHISDLVIKSGAPIFVFADDPPDVINDITMSFGGDAYNAMRLTSRCFSTLNDIFGAPAAICIRREHYDHSVRTLVQEVLSVFCDPVKDEQLERVMRNLRIDPLAVRGSTIGEQISLHFPHAEKRGSFRSLPAAEAIERVVRAYEVIAVQQALHEIEWPRDIFLRSDCVGEFVSGHQELVGPARFLIYGPYMHLPRGNWIARVEIEVSENYSGSRLLSDVVSGEILNVTVADLPGNGVFAFEMQFETLDPLLPIEIRFQLQTGAIEGKFLLRRVTIRRVAHPFSNAETAR
jgi:hypothetical protein